MSFPLPARVPKVQLMLTCLCDAFFDQVGRATVEVLERLGCEVGFPEGQTCCAQPAFNSGDWDAARSVARHTLRVFAGDTPVVVPSGSCARMVSHGALMLFEREQDSDQASGLARRSFELAEFIVDRLGITRWPGKLERRVAFHRSCHSRGTSYGSSALTLLRSIEGLSLVEFDEAEQCCGFGGTFSVTFPAISQAIGSLKLDRVLASEPELLVSSDMGCLLHVAGLAEKQGRAVPTQHLAELLRDSLLTAERGRA